MNIVSGLSIFLAVSWVGLWSMICGVAWSYVFYHPYLVYIYTYFPTKLFEANVYPVINDNAFLPLLLRLLSRSIQ